MDNRVLIKAALQALLQQPPENKPWVVINHASGKFVQFAGSSSEPLVLDLPWQPLSEAEFYRAVVYFKQFGVVGADQEMFDIEGQRASPQFTFNMTFRSVEEATVTALALFEQVYGLPTADELRIETSWARR